jgi:hypothetical protein
MKITTNNVPRDVIDAYLLTEAERADFDYLPWDLIDKGEDSASFVRYKGELIDLGDVPSTYTYSPDGPSSIFPGWDGYVSDSFFSGILIRYASDSDFESVIVGRYCT